MIFIVNYPLFQEELLKLMNNADNQYR